MDLTNQVYEENIRSRYHAALAHVLIGFFNVMVAILHPHPHILQVNSDDLMISTPTGDDNDVIIQDIFNWIFSDGVQSRFLRMVGGEIMFPLARIGWGWESLIYFYFLQPPDPGCGPQDREEIYQKYIQLSSIGDLLSGGISVPWQEL